MSGFLLCAPGDRGLDLLLVVASGVAVLSAAARAVAWRLGGDAALRHLVLLAALLNCLALPVTASLCAMAGVTLVSLSIPRDEPISSASPVLLAKAAPAGVRPLQPAPDPLSVAWAPEAKQFAVSCASPATTAAGRVDPPLPSRDLSPGAASTTVPNPWRRVAVGMMSVWATGTLLLLVRLAWSCVAVVRLRRSCRLIDTGPVHALLQEAAARLGMRRVPRLLLSNRVISPAAFGLGRPAVLLPARLIGAVDDDRLRDVLVHEVAHLRRFDPWIVLLQQTVAAVYWPIPWVHAVNRELRRAGEELCDDAVLARRDALSYGETLLHVAELLAGARTMAAVPGVVGGPGELEWRIARLIGRRPDAAATTGRTAARVAMCLFVAGTAVASATRLDLPAEPAAEAPGGGPADVRLAEFCCPA